MPTTPLTFQPSGLPTLIGSIPLTDHQQALELIATYTPEIPLWPQLPFRPEEGMLVQFIDSFPGISETGGKAYFQTSAPDFGAELLAFFEDYLLVSEDRAQLPESRFATSRHRAPGLYLLHTIINDDTVAVKGQLTGPFTLLTGLCDENKRLGYYDPTIRELVVKGTAMTAAWQADFLGRTGKPVILFLDEPALAGLGSSAYISIAKEDIAADLNEVIDAVHQQGGLVGIHVCANTDWDFLLGLQLDIVNFDAYGFFDRFASSQAQVHSFLDRGGIIAWGGIPTSNKEPIEREDVHSLTTLWERHMEQISSPRYDLPTLLRRTLITPSCGTGSLTPALAQRVLQLTCEVSRSLREKYRN